MSSEGREVQGHRARRARKRGAAQVESFSLAEIAKRDGYRCGICRRKVDMTRPYPRPRSPSLDHVIPLALDGDHTKANAQLAHFMCNSIKSDRVVNQQLALIG